MHISSSDSTARAAAGVLVVDDHAATLRGVCRLVETASGLVLVAQADSGEAAVALAGQLEPDLVLMDVRMNGMDGIAATRAIKAMRGSTVVVLISTVHPDDLTREAHTCGADEVVWKGDLGPVLLQQIWSRHRASDGHKPPVG